MRTIQTVRFKLSQLIEWAQHKMGMAPSVAEAMTWYMNRTLGRGWAIKAAIGAPVREPEIIYARDIAGAQVALMRDELWTVIWEGDQIAEVDGDADFLDELEELRRANSAKFTAAVCDQLEDLGWKLDPARDGYVRGDGLCVIGGEEIGKARGEDPVAVAEELALRAWRTREMES